jgi:porin
MKYFLPLALLIVLAVARDCKAQANVYNFGGPDTVPNRIRSDRATTNFLFDFGPPQSYYDFKDCLQEKSGYAFQADYFSVYLKSSDSLPGTTDEASSGVFRFSGFWELFGRGTDTTGTLIYLVEHRHRYGETTPAPFSIDNLGNVGAIEIPFADDGWHLTNLYWSQSWCDGTVVAVAGFLDITDFVDVHPLTSPWTDFSNFAFSIGVSTMDLPDDASLGLAVGAWLTEGVYVIAGFEDLNSDPNCPSKGFNTFFGDHEYFKHVEIGWTGSGWDEYYFNNVHLTLWHADRRETTGVPEGSGGVLSFTKSLGQQWQVFARGGLADGGGSLMERSVSIGFGYQPQIETESAPADQMGFGFNWGDPNDNLFGPTANEQCAIETYYRSQITKEFSITPSVQVLFDPALNPGKDSIWVLGLRGRFVL